MSIDLDACGWLGSQSRCVACGMMNCLALSKAGLHVPITTSRLRLLVSTDFYKVVGTPCFVYMK